MYKLTYSPASPYVRKVMLAAYSIKINHEIDLVSSENKFFQDFKSKNPLSKIPILMKPNGDYLFDSRVIIDYFNRLEGSLIPIEGKERDIVMTKCALTEGIIDAALLYVYSNFLSSIVHFNPHLNLSQHQTIIFDSFCKYFDINNI